MVLAWFPITSSWNPACYIRGLIHGTGRRVPNVEIRCLIQGMNASPLVKTLSFHYIYTRNKKLIVKFSKACVCVCIHGSEGLHSGNMRILSESIQSCEGLHSGDMRVLSVSSQSCQGLSVVTWEYSVRVARFARVYTVVTREYSVRVARVARVYTVVT